MIFYNKEQQVSVGRNGRSQFSPFAVHIHTEILDLDDRGRGYDVFFLQLQAGINFLLNGNFLAGGIDRGLGRHVKNAQ